MIYGGGNRNQDGIEVKTNEEHGCVEEGPQDHCSTVDRRRYRCGCKVPAVSTSTFDVPGGVIWRMNGSVGWGGCGCGDGGEDVDVHGCGR